MGNKNGQPLNGGVAPPSGAVHSSAAPASGQGRGGAPDAAVGGAGTGGAPLAACATPLHNNGTGEPPNGNFGSSASGGQPGQPAAGGAKPAAAAKPAMTPAQQQLAQQKAAEGCGGCLSGGPPVDPTAARRRGRHGANMGSGMTPDDFELLQVVGKGSFGKVFQVRKKDTGKIYAMKVLKKEQLLKRKQVAHTQTERKVLEEIDHPFIVSLRFAFQTHDKLYMVLDYFNGGELFFHLKANGRFSEELARFYAAEIVLAIECLHENTIVYRDLKPENVLLDEEGHIRLTDFGLSKDSISGNTLTHTFCGTPEYLAPEIIHGAGYNKAVDWWSLGTLLYEMLTGLPPFFNTNVHVMYEKIMRATLAFPAYVSPEAQSLLTGLLQRNPQARLGGGPRDALDLKEHPFFAPIDWVKLTRKEVVPPFKPYTKDGVEDISNVPDEFKKEAPKDTPVNPSALKARVNFPDFSYAAPDAAGGIAAATAEQPHEENHEILG
jgi:serine/threonine protein kinase